MKAIRLVLTSPRGDELGRLLLGEVAVAAAGERSAGERPSLAGEMEELVARIQTTVAEEGMAVGLDPIDCRIAISRALMQESDREEIQIVLPVHEASPEAGGVLDLSGESDGDSLFPLDDLFPFAALEEESHEAEG